MQRLLSFLLATPLAVTLAVDISYQDADTNNDNKISGTECAALNNGDTIVVGDDYFGGSVDIGSESGDDCSRITVDLSQAYYANSINIGNPNYPVCLSSDVNIDNPTAVKIYDQNCNTDFEITTSILTRELILKSTCAPSATFDAMSGMPNLKLDYPDTCVQPGISFYDSTNRQVTWSTEVRLSDVPESIKTQIKAGITKDEVPQHIKDQIKAEITKDEVPASMVDEIKVEAVEVYKSTGITKADIPSTLVTFIEQEAVEAMTPEALKTAYETKVVQQACPP